MVKHHIILFFTKIHFLHSYIIFLQYIMIFFLFNINNLMGPPHISRAKTATILTHKIMIQIRYFSSLPYVNKCHFYSTVLCYYISLTLVKCSYCKLFLCEDINTVKVEDHFDYVRGFFFNIC